MRGLMQDVPLTLDTIFRHVEQHHGDVPIVTNGPGGTVRSTYGEWADRTRRLGGVLDTLGVSADGRVGTFAWNSQRHLELYYGVPCTGRVLHTLNIRLFPEQLTYIVNHGEDEVVFVDRTVLPLLWPLIDTMPTVRAVVVMDDGGTNEVPDDPRVADYETLLAAAEPVGFGVVRDENTAASMCYTSGTTGNPKGVLYSHRSTVLHAMAVISPNGFGIGVDDVAMPVVPMFHANAWGLAQAAPMAGAAMVFPGAMMQPQALADLIVAEGVTFTAGVPTIWQGMLPHLAGREHRLRKIGCGGSAVPAALSEAYREQVGLPIYQAWGMTETHPVASGGTLARRYDDADEATKAALRARQGVPLFGVQARIVTAGTTDELPWDDEATGELQVRGPWCAASYYEEPGTELTTEDGWMKTGDIAALDAFGSIRIADRTKDLIKSGGEWISSVDLENAIMGHPAVAEAAVVAVPHPTWGERPLACVVVKPGETLTEAQVLDHLRPLVASWWLPDAVEFIDEVPKTSVGKFSKKDLRSRFAEYPAKG